MSQDLASRVEAACAQLADAGATVTFTAVAAKGLSENYLRRSPLVGTTV
jgi:hypothetical protein